MVVNKGSEGTYDTSHCSAPCVIKDGSVYKMWYDGNDGTNWRIIYCTSTDGINWSNFQMVVDKGSEGVYDTAHAQIGNVIKSNDVYKMWYIGYDSTNYRIIYCTSLDCVNWSNFQMVLDKGSQGTYDTTHAYEPEVFMDGDLYRMYYGGYSGSTWRLLGCSSSDGINWSDYFLAVNINSQGTYDTTYSFRAGVLKDDDTYKIWYSGFNNITNGRIIYTSSPTPEWKTATQSVWNNNHIGVWHMNALNPKDSTRHSDGISYNQSSIDIINGFSGKALKADGVSGEYVSTNHVSAHAKTSGFSVEFVGLVNESGNGSCIHKHDTGNAYGWGISLRSNKKVYFSLKKDAGDNYYGVMSSNTFSVGWHHVAFVYVGDGSTPKIFVDGEEISTSVWAVLGNALSGIVDSGQGIRLVGHTQQLASSPAYGYGASDEVRYYGAVLSDLYIKSSYYSISDALLYFVEDQIPYDYIFRGIIKEKGMPVQRRVCAYRRSTNLLAGSTTSSVDGYYYITTPYNEEHYIVVLDNDSGDDYNALIQDRVYPSLT